MTRLDRFRVLEPIADTARGRIVAAWDPELERKVALEVASSVDDGSLDAAKAIARLMHPNVVRVHEVGESAGQIFIVRELVGGDTLEDWCAVHSELSAARFRGVLELAIQAARGVVAAHAAGLVHRHLGLDTLLVEPNGRLRLATLEAADARSDVQDDQRALCATFWTAALGVQPPTLSNAAPRWFVAVLRRGLAKDPAERWPDVATLLARLEQGRDRSRRRPLVVLGILAASAGTAAVLMQPRPSDPCVESAQPLADVWSASAREALESRFAAEQRSASTDAFESLARRLDHFVATWDAAYSPACEAARLARTDDGTPPLAWDAPQLACLDEARTGFVVVLEEIEQLEATKLNAATSLTLALPDPQRCRERTRAAVGPDAREVARRLARAQALVGLRQLDDAEAILVELETESWANSPILESRGQATLASSAYARGDYVLAYRHGRAALTMAERADDGESEATSWILVATAELAREHLVDAMFAVERGHNIADAIGTPMIVADARRLRARVEMQRGEYTHSVAEYRAAEQIILQQRGASHESLAKLYGDMVPALGFTGQLQESVAVARRSLVVFEDTLGAANPRTTRAVATLGMALADAGESVEAIEILARADAAFRADPNASPDDRFAVRLRRAEHLAFTRRFDDALAELAELRTVAADDDARRLVDSIRAMAWMESGRAELAVASYEALLAESPGDAANGHFDAFNRAVIRVNLAIALSRTERIDEAVALIEPTIAAYETLGMSAPRLAGALVELSQVYRAAERPADAIALCERAIALSSTSGDESATTRARAELDRAVALAEALAK